MERINKLLEAPCYVVDFLPEQVSKESNGQFFEVENFLLSHHEWYGLRDRFVRFILKVMCYYSVSIYQNGWIEEPSPEQMVEMLDSIIEEHSCDMNIMIKDTLIQFGGDCLHMSVYNPEEEMCELLKQIRKKQHVY